MRIFVEKLFAWLEERCRWSQLRTLGGSNLVRTSVLMPAFGYMLLLNHNVHQYLTITYDGRLLNYLPPTWRVWFLFYGSFFLATAAILYAVLCPSEIKRYVSPFEMADAQTKHRVNLGDYQSVQDRLRESYGAISKTDEKLLGFPKRDLENLNSFGTDWARRISNMLVHHWTAVNVGKKYWRIGLLLMFSLGLGLIAVPAVFTFLQVTALALKLIVSR